MIAVWIVGALLLGLAVSRIGLPPLVGFLASGFVFAALGMDGTPPEVHRSLGILLRQTGDNAEATRAFQRYLELKPRAEDAELIRSYLPGNSS